MKTTATKLHNNKGHHEWCKLNTVASWELPTYDVTYHHGNERGEPTASYIWTRLTLVKILCPKIKTAAKIDCGSFDQPDLQSQPSLGLRNYQLKPKTLEELPPLFRGLYGVHPDLIQMKPNDVNMHPTGLEKNTRSLTDYAQNYWTFKPCTSIDIVFMLLHLRPGRTGG